MERRRLAATLLALLGTLLAAWQCWLVYLPHELASRIDFCQIAPALDCFRSLNAFGESMRPFGVPAFPALASLFAFQLMLSALAWTTRRPPRAALWRAWAGLGAFPAAGLAVYVLLHDLLFAKATSPSALLVLLVALASCGLAAWGGLAGWRGRSGRGTALAVLLGCALGGFFVHGAGTARLESALVQRERQAAPPQLRWARFAPAQPRVGSAILGDPRARAEVLLFLDLEDPAQADLAREAARAVTAYGDRLRVVLYAPGPLGAGLVEAAAGDRLGAFLQTPTAASGGQPVRPALVDPGQWRERAGVERLPSAIARDGRAEGELDLAAFLASAAAPDG